MRYATGRKQSGEGYALRDPREKEIASALEKADKDGEAVANSLLALPGLFPASLSGDAVWADAVKRRLSVMLERGMRAAIDEEAAAYSG
jgi:fructuronate reductase